MISTLTGEEYRSHLLSGSSLARYSDLELEIQRSIGIGLFMMELMRLFHTKHDASTSLPLHP
jgi:hypothetical protein